MLRMQPNPLPRAAMTMEINMTSDRLLNEIERQRKYLARLPKDFTYPLFNSKQALESQRRNGYRNTAAAAREIVDLGCPCLEGIVHDFPSRCGGIPVTISALRFQSLL